MNDLPPIDRAVFDSAAPWLAARLIGVGLLVDGVGGVIVETEAYTRDDPASHSFRGPTLRNAAMFGPAGTAYVYRSYGLHWCFNIVAADAGAVLVRAIEPRWGLPLMAERRKGSPSLCAGPGRLAQALAIDAALDGRPLDAPPFRLVDRNGAPSVVTGTRVGISRAMDRPWRFGLAGSRYFSRPFAER